MVKNVNLNCVVAHSILAQALMKLWGDSYHCSHHSKCLSARKVASIMRHWTQIFSRLMRGAARRRRRRRRRLWRRWGGRSLHVFAGNCPSLYVRGHATSERARVRPLFAQVRPKGSRSLMPHKLKYIISTLFRE